MNFINRATNVLDTLQKITLNVGEIVEKDFQKYTSNPSKIITNIGSFSVQVLNTSKRIYREFILFYPKATIIAHIALAIFTAFYNCIPSILILLANSYYIFSLRNLIAATLEVHSKNDISEIDSPYEEKEELREEVNSRIALENAKELFNDVKESVKDFFHKFV